MRGQRPYALVVVNGLHFVLDYMHGKSPEKRKPTFSEYTYTESNREDAGNQTLGGPD